LAIGSRRQQFWLPSAAANRLLRIYAERQHYFAVHRVQRAQLRDDQEQKEHAEQARVQEILPSLPLPHAA